MNYPIIALIGRVNVGKSTLFNRLIRKKQALVADFEGLTVDRQYGQHVFEGLPYSVIDTAGFANKTSLNQRYIEQQINIAIEEASVLFVIVDGKKGLHPEDLVIVNMVRQTSSKMLYLIVNKVDHDVEKAFEQMNEFYKLGIKNTFFISALSGKNCFELIEHIKPHFSTNTPHLLDNLPKPYIGILGKPNAGKSTLVNAILNENRMVTSSQAGTTKDSISTPIVYNKKPYTLIDTPGIRRRKNIKDFIEKLSISSAIEVIHYCHVVVLVVDASIGITEQDVTLINLSFYHDKEVILWLNKIDLLNSSNQYQLEYSLDKKLSHVPFLCRVHGCALRKTGMPDLFKNIDTLTQTRQKTFPTHQVNQWVSQAVSRAHPPAYNNKIVRVKYAHQISTQQAGSSLQFMVHGSHVQQMAEHYKRYLVRYFRNAASAPHNLISVRYKNKNVPID